MNDIVARLRAEIAWEPEVGELMAEAADEITRLTLTDAEREAIVTALAYLREDIDEKGIEIDAAALRGLLERTK